MKSYYCQALYLTMNLINPDFPEDVKKEIHNALKVPVDSNTIAELENIGSLGVISKNKMIVHPEVTEDEEKQLKKIFKVEITKATVNFGSPYVRSGCAANDHGFVIGKNSTGVEIGTIDEGLGFLD